MAIIGKSSGKKWQFKVDGRPIGPVRNRWIDAARDAVCHGVAVWTGVGKIRLDRTFGAALVEVK